MGQNAPSSRFAATLAAELNPQQIVRSLMAGGANFLLEAMIVVSFAVLIFSGELSSHVSSGITLMLVADAVMMIIVALLSSYAGSIAILQDAPVAVMAAAVVGLLAAAPRSAGPDQLYATAVMLIIVTSVAAGLFFLVLGYLKLGGLARFLPFPVMGGFLAGTGWLLFVGALGVMSGVPLGLDFLRAGTVIYWLPGLALGAILLIASSRISHPLVLPVVVAAAAGIFYLVAWLANAPVSQLQANGWLLGNIPGGGSWQPALTPEMIHQTNWPLLISRLGSVAAVPIVAAISLLLNANGIELMARRDIDLNRELIATGFANLATGLVGGTAGYPALSLSGLNQSMSGGRRLTGVITAILIGVTVLVGTAFLSLAPKFLLGGLLIFLGLSMLYEWVFRAWFRFSRVDFLIIVLIMAVIVWRGFLVGLAAGLVATTIMFVVSSSRVSVVRHARSGAQVRSRVNRSPAERAVLQARPDELYVLELQGFIFFGTANALYVRLAEEMRSVISIRCVLIDFSRVIGLDSTGLRSFEKLRQLCQERGVQLVLSGTGRAEQPWAAMAGQFARGGFVEQPGLLHFAGDLDHGIEWYEEQVLAGAAIVDDSNGCLRDELGAILPPDQIAAILRYMVRRCCEAGERLISQGDAPDSLFFIDSGQVSALVEQPGRDPVRLETLRAGRSVGELGFYLDTRRSAAVVADRPTCVYVLSRDALDRLEVENPQLAAGLHRLIAHLLAERVLHLMRVVDGLQQ